MQIYWIRDGKKQGPASVPDVESMLQLGELTPDTPGWHAGCKTWLPLIELPALANVEPNPSISIDIGKTLPAELPRMLFDVVLPSPAVRFLARMVDMALYATLLLGVLYIIQAPYSERYLPGGPAFWFPLVVIEVCCIRLCGTTPGKWLLGIRMQRDRARITGIALFMRSCLAFVMGLGCMYPIFVVVMLALSYFNVRRRGLAVWDTCTGIVPMVSAAPTAARRFGACLIIMLCMQLSSVFMQPWLPDMIDAIRERDADTAHTLEEWMQLPRR